MNVAPLYIKIDFLLSVNLTRLDVIASADYIIDMGPGSGARGGRLVAAGTPEEICASPASVTGLYLKPHLEFVKSSATL